MAKAITFAAHGCSDTNSGASGAKWGLALCIPEASRRPARKPGACGNSCSTALIQLNTAERPSRAAQSKRPRTRRLPRSPRVSQSAPGRLEESKHAAQWEKSLTRDAKAIANLPVAAIDTAHVLQAEPIWKRSRNRQPHARPHRARNRLRDRSEISRREDGNPARWDGHLEELLGSKARAARAKRERTGKSGHHLALPYRHAPDFMQALRRLDSLSARALEFTVFTAARTAETIGMKWSEVDFEERTWTVPAGRMKMKKQHRVPLSDRAMEILRGLERHGEHVFPLSNMAMLECLRGLWPGVTVHGCRSTFRDWCKEQTNYPREIAELALAHVLADKSEAAYSRGDALDKRRQLMAAWTRYCGGKPAATGATVTPMRKLADA